MFQAASCMITGHAQCTPELFSHHSGVSGDTGHLVGSQLLVGGLAGAGVLLEPLDLHLGLLLDDPVSWLGMWYSMRTSDRTDFCSRTTPPARAGTKTTAPATARAAAAAALMAGIVVSS
jgi:hypothetical protein